jgi:hypothetical protein
MTPLILIVGPGLLGGLILAFVLFRYPIRPEHPPRERYLDAPSTDIINMARVRVSGVGGLGMVAMATTVAIFVPRIRLTMAIALVLGGIMAAAMIAVRRRRGPLGSGVGPGAHAMFPLDKPSASAGQPARRWPDNGHTLGVASAKP